MLIDWPNLLTGAAVGLAISQYLAWLSSRELRQIAGAFAEIAEQQELVKWKRDKKGRITFYRIIRGTGTLALPL